MTCKSENHANLLIVIVRKSCRNL